jgi:hypothetical protein
MFGSHYRNRCNTTKGGYSRTVPETVEDENEFRLGYYMCRKGRWWWGQYAPMLPPDDVKFMVDEMRKRGWV